jgi:hypothetical protein
MRKMEGCKEQETKIIPPLFAGMLSEADGLAGGGGD